MDDESINMRRKYLSQGGSRGSQSRPIQATRLTVQGASFSRLVEPSSLGCTTL